MIQEKAKEDTEGEKKMIKYFHTSLSKLEKHH